MSDSKSAIRAVARRTGLSVDVIRVWERRYGAVEPSRTASGRRVYGDAEIERLRLLRAATRAGHSIGQIASLADEQLLKLIEADRQESQEGVSPEAVPHLLAEPYVEKCLDAVVGMDAEAMEAALSRAALLLGHPVVMDDVMTPLLERIDEFWEDGRLSIAQEHMASAAIRVFLSGLTRHVRIEPDAPTLLVTTPAGQVHEIGALMVAATAAWQGWQVLYLGPNLPAEEIALAARKSAARVVALSIVYPSYDVHIEDELKALRKQLPRRVAILAGGRVAESYSQILDEIGALRARDMAGARQHLDALRTSSRRLNKKKEVCP